MKKDRFYWKLAFVTPRSAISYGSDYNNPDIHPLVISHDDLLSEIIIDYSDNVAKIIIDSFRLSEKLGFGFHEVSTNIVHGYHWSSEYHEKNVLILNEGVPFMLELTDGLRFQHHSRKTTYTIECTLADSLEKSADFIVELIKPELIESIKRSPGWQKRRKMQSKRMKESSESRRSIFSDNIDTIDYDWDIQIPFVGNYVHWPYEHFGRYACVEARLNIRLDVDRLVTAMWYEVNHKKNHLYMPKDLITLLSLIDIWEQAQLKSIKELNEKGCAYPVSSTKDRFFKPLRMDVTDWGEINVEDLDSIVIIEPPEEE